MDADKLNEATVEYRNSTNVSTENFCLTDIEDAFIAGAQWLMQQPLADRLTGEEKERIRAIYKDYEELETYGEALSDRTAGRMQCFTLEQIFGKELFNEKWR